MPLMQHQEECSNVLLDVLGTKEDCRYILCYSKDHNSVTTTMILNVNDLPLFENSMHETKFRRLDPCSVETIEVSVKEFIKESINEYKFQYGGKVSYIGISCRDYNLSHSQEWEIRFLNKNDIDEGILVDYTNILIKKEYYKNITWKRFFSFQREMDISLGRQQQTLNWKFDKFKQYAEQDIVLMDLWEGI